MLENWLAWEMHIHTFAIRVLWVETFGEAHFGKKAFSKINYLIISDST